MTKARTVGAVPKSVLKKMEAKPQPASPLGPTEERQRRGDITKADKSRKKSEHIYSVVSPLDRLLRQGVIDTGQHTAGQRFAKHHYYAGLTEHMGSVDLNAVRGASETSYGMPTSEFMADQRREYRDAIQAIGSWRSTAFQLFVCGDCSLEETGYRMGLTNRVQAVAAAREMVCGKLAMLCELWGIPTDAA